MRLLPTCLSTRLRLNTRAPVQSRPQTTTRPVDRSSFPVPAVKAASIKALGTLADVRPGSWSLSSGGAFGVATSPGSDGLILIDLTGPEQPQILSLSLKNKTVLRTAWASQADRLLIVVDYPHPSIRGARAVGAMVCDAQGNAQLGGIIFCGARSSASAALPAMCLSPQGDALLFADAAGQSVHRVDLHTQVQTELGALGDARASYSNYLIRKLEFSASGNFLLADATHRDNSKVSLSQVFWNEGKSKPLFNVNHLSWSPTADQLCVSSSSEHQVNLYTLSKENGLDLQNSVSRGFRGEFSIDGRALKVHPTRTLDDFIVVPTDGSAQPDAVESIFDAWSADGKSWAAITSEDNLLLRHVDAGRKQPVETRLSGLSHAVAPSFGGPNKRFVAALGQDGRVVLFDANTARELGRSPQAAWTDLSLARTALAPLGGRATNQPKLTWSAGGSILCFTCPKGVAIFRIGTPATPVGRLLSALRPPLV
jgi:hypothetical protein